MIVADTNILAYLFLPGPHSERVARVMDADDQWYAPTLWRSEFRNALAGYLRASQLDLPSAKRIAAKAETLMRGNEELVLTDEVLDCLAASNCTAYDCEFVALARKLGVPLVTVDRKLIAAFPDVAISPDEFLESRTG